MPGRWRLEVNLVQGTAEEANEAKTRAAKMTIRLELDGVN